uniref:Cell cycle regulatory protein n=1 Tax=Ganoderma boninense TaxID=34458 RepID=A0A5K1K660_9APHY|nr:Cell cycle regulatory protein [Ganoderma boninense]
MSSAFIPALGVYAAIRMDPAAMVAHLDAQAIEEAQKIRPKTYLVLTEFGLSLPFPGWDWYAYNVRPVGPSIRVVYDKRGYESDMCVPIFPNETHPTGRPPVHPGSDFPYDNCFHWAAMDMDVRILAREEGFDNTRAIRLPVRQRMDMDLQFRPDLGRAKRTRLAREEAMSLPPDHVAPSDASSSPPTTETSEGVDAGGEVDIFEPQVDFEDPEYIPLADLWLDLAETLKQEDIGDPVDLYRERYAVISLIRRAHERNPDLPTLREYLAPPQDPCADDPDCDSYMSGTASSYVSEADESELSDCGVSKPKRESIRVLVALE